jgi:hypothetical protein
MLCSLVPLLLVKLTNLVLIWAKLKRHQRIYSLILINNPESMLLTKMELRDILILSPLKVRLSLKMYGSDIQLEKMNGYSKR